MRPANAEFQIELNATADLLAPRISWLKRPATVVVLVEPAGPINVGSVAPVRQFEVRNCVWSARLRSPDPEACRMAVHGLEL